MKSKLKLIFPAIVRLLKKVLGLPQFISAAIAQRRQGAALDKLETERLDRIRNPSKYLGK